MNYILEERQNIITTYFRTYCYILKIFKNNLLINIIMEISSYKKVNHVKEFLELLDKISTNEIKNKLYRDVYSDEQFKIDLIKFTKEDKYIPYYNKYKELDNILLLINSYNK